MTLRGERLYCTKAKKGVLKYTLPVLKAILVHRWGYKHTISCYQERNSSVQMHHK